MKYIEKNWNRVNTLLIVCTSRNIVIYYNENFENTKRVIRNHKSNDRQFFLAIVLSVVVLMSFWPLYCLSLSLCLSGHCIVRHLICGFWLPFWYFQSFHCNIWQYSVKYRQWAEYSHDSNSFLYISYKTTPFGFCFLFSSKYHLEVNCLQK
jgi:hypothetical protein